MTTSPIWSATGWTISSVQNEPSRYQPACVWTLIREGCLATRISHVESSDHKCQTLVSIDCPAPTTIWVMSRVQELRRLADAGRIFTTVCESLASSADVEAAPDVRPSIDSGLVKIRGRDSLIAVAQVLDKQVAEQLLAWLDDARDLLRSV